MRSRRRIVLLAFVAALVAALFAMPILKGHACRKAGGSWDRDTLTCHPAVAPALRLPAGQALRINSSRRLEAGAAA